MEALFPNEQERTSFCHDLSVLLNEEWDKLSLATLRMLTAWRNEAMEEAA